jgi:hypothetical protein
MKNKESNLKKDLKKNFSLILKKKRKLLILSKNYIILIFFICQLTF